MVILNFRSLEQQLFNRETICLSTFTDIAELKI